MSEKKHAFSVLFVDDEEQTRKYFKMGLKSHFDIFTAESVAQAKEILATEGDKIGVVITDQRMPGGNGVELLRFLKNQYPKIIRLLATAYSDLAEAIEAVNSGEIFRYIQKPWKDFDALRIELSQAMELFEIKQQRDELLREKFTIRKKMAKVERIRMIFSMATSLGVNITAVQELLKILANEESSNEIILDNLDFGKQDILEARFQINLAQEIKNKMTNWNGQNIDKANVFNLLQVEVSEDLQFKIALNNNFLTADSNNFNEDGMVNLLVLCLICDSKNMVVNMELSEGVISCEIVAGGSKSDELENIILLAILA